MANKTITSQFNEIKADVKNAIKSIEKEAKKTNVELEKSVKSILEIFYIQRTPQYYNRTEQLLKNTIEQYSPSYDNGKYGSEYSVGVGITSEKISYKHGNLTSAAVMNYMWYKGIRGTKNYNYYYKPSGVYYGRTYSGNSPDEIMRKILDDWYDIHRIDNLFAN